MLATPGKGHWHEPLNKIAMVPMLDELIQRGLLAEADNLVRRLTEARKERLLPALVRLGTGYYDRGNWEKAKEHFAVAVKIDSTFVGVELALASRREKEGRLESAVKLYGEALRRSPNHPTALNRLAWLLCTSDDAAVRNSQRAMTLAEKAAKITGRINPSILDTLAASYAAGGDFDKAIEVATQAAELTVDRGQLQLLQEIESHIDSYRRGESLRIKSNPRK